MASAAVTVPFDKGNRNVPHLLSRTCATLSLGQSFRVSGSVPFIPCNYGLVYHLTHSSVNFGMEIEVIDALEFVVQEQDTT